MTPPEPIIRLRRKELIRALDRPAVEFQILAALLVRACPVTGRVWEPPERLAEALDLPLSLVEDSLRALGSLDFLEDHPTLLQQLRCIELGAVFLRSSAPPANLPVEPLSPSV